MMEVNISGCLLSVLLHEVEDNDHGVIDPTHEPLLKLIILYN